MRVITVGAVCTVGLVVALASPVAAKPLERERYSFEESATFTDTGCGESITIDFTWTGSGVFMLKEGRRGDPTPYYFDNHSSVETFTNVANGETATLVHQSLFKDLRIEHVEGTIYRFTAIETGRPVVAYGPDGKKLVFDRGRIRHTVLIDTKGDSDIENDEEFEETYEADVAGPHPIFFEEATFCDLLDLIR